MTQENLPMVVYWHENQVAITLHSDKPITTNASDVLKSLKLDDLNHWLHSSGFTLTSFQEVDVFHSPKIATAPAGKDQESASYAGSQSINPIDSPCGKYLFRSPDGKGTSIISFFHIEAKSAAPANPAAGSTNSEQDQDWDAPEEPSSQGEYYEDDSTSKVVHLINQHLYELRHDKNVPIISAMPNWLKGGSVLGCMTHGSIVTPPLPVDMATTSGRWKTSLPAQLPPSLLNDGTGVTVLVLDTLRSYTDVSAVAASQSGTGNSLLQDIVHNVTFNYNTLPAILDTPNPEQPGTGKDVYGRLIGFPMADHGIFVAGIIRDIAPGAHVECIRVLNDFGAGNTTGLIQVLENIQQRLLHVESAGSPLNLPLVINLSLVSTPPDEVLLASPNNFDLNMIYQLREGLYEAIQSLTSQGVVFVAAAGNDSDPRDNSSIITLPNGTTTPKRFGPRYPAAFAYDESIPGQAPRSGIAAVIPVGALNQAENAASYSNYPGAVGIATYGGELRTPELKDAPSTPPPAPPYGSPTKIVAPIDALRGVYTAALFPAPSMDDRLSPPSPQPPDYPEYAPTSPTTWAYWVGTSFATPIISALAARALYNQGATSASVRQTLLAAAAQKPLWTGLDAQSNTPTSGNIIMVTQEYVSA